VAPLFDSYVMVDWSAESRPKLGADSIWVALHVLIGNGVPDVVAAANPPTRAAAAALIESMLQFELAEGRRVLIGFDFPLGYPQGFAARLGLAGAPWRAIWQEYARLLVDDAANGNRRFALAETLNRRVSGGAFPFWGRPATAGYTALEPRHHRRHEAEGLAERRLVDLRARSSQTVWKLLGIGAAGGQALTGIPVAERLKQRFGAALQVWPFETGLAAPDTAGPAITLVEIYPSLFPVVPEPGEVKDAAQTRVTARHFAELDSRGELARLFAGDPSLSEIERAAVVAEEGWVLGVTGVRTNPKTPSPPHWGGEGRGEVGRARKAQPLEPAIGTTALQSETSAVERSPPHPNPLPPNGAEREKSTRGRRQSASAPARRYKYLAEPAAIYARSFAIARAETDLSALPAELHALALRIVHAAADPGLLRDLVWSPGAAQAGRQALADGAPILVDVEMVAHGITRSRLPAGNQVLCTLRDPAVPGLAARLQTTRSAAAVELWRPQLAGAVVAIGNAPTALFHLLEMIADGAPRPALVLGFPVGFVGAAESKAALAANELGLAYVALTGRRGGSALAAAAVNALAGPAEEGR
jgi:precorrin-8X/cobalt-precorrin-8 methylmutase